MASATGSPGHSSSSFPPAAVPAWTGCGSAPTEVVSVDGMPTMSVERTIADLIEQWVDRSLVADALADAADAGKLLSPARLTEYLEPLAKPNKYPSGAALAADLLALAGVDAVVPADA